MLRKKAAFRTTTVTTADRKPTRFILFWSLALIFLVGDQVSKTFIHNWDRLPFGNKGAAWGILSGYGFGLAILAIVAMAAIYWFREHLQLRRLDMQFAFGCMVGGIAGNMIDRLMHGHVIDFLDFHLPGYRWPAFNMADIGIVTGVILYVFSTFFLQEESSETRKDS